MPEIPYLSSLEVFAVRVKVAADCLKVGILVLGEDFQPGTHTLYAESGEAFTVTILGNPGTTYNAELPLIHALPL